MASDTRFFRKVIGGPRELTQLQTNVEQAVGQVIRNPLINGRLVEGIALTTTTYKLEHKLGRPVRGYIVVGNGASAIIHDNLSTETQPELYLPLIASTATTVNLWVY